MRVIREYLEIVDHASYRQTWKSSRRLYSYMIMCAFNSLELDPIQAHDMESTTKEELNTQLAAQLPDTGTGQKWLASWHRKRTRSSTLEARTCIMFTSKNKYAWAGHAESDHQCNRNSCAASECNARTMGRTRGTRRLSWVPCRDNAESRWVWASTGVT